MAITEQKVIDQICADQYGNVLVRERISIVKDGEVIASTYHRTSVGPNDSLKDLDSRVAAIARAARKDTLPLPKIATE